MKKFLFLLFTGVLALNTLSASSKDGYTEIIYIIDESGSMKGVEADVVESLNLMIKEQQSKAGDVIISTVMFSEGSYFLHNRVDIKDVGVITRDNYRTGGSTALYDAIGNTITKIGNKQKSLREKQRAKRVLFVITTDGDENSSEEYSGSDIRALIEEYQTDHGWDFLFVGANIDAKKVAESIGIAPERAAKYRADALGTMILNESISSVLSSVRQDEEISLEWSEGIEEDTNLRENQPEVSVDGNLEHESEEMDNIKPDKYPSFKGGGMMNFRVWTLSQIQYPNIGAKNYIQGKVVVSFFVEKDGSVGRVKVLFSPHELLSEEIIRVVKSSPKWAPGLVDGKSVSVSMILPVLFKTN